MPPTAEERLQKYMENIKKANRKYRETHKDTINEKKRNYYHTKLANDEEFLEKKRAYAKQRYWKKKEEKLTESQTQI